jgi:hypothetical protein
VKIARASSHAVIIPLQLRLSAVSWRNLVCDCVKMGDIHHLKSFLCLGDVFVMFRYLRRDGEPRSSDVLVVVYKYKMTLKYVSTQAEAIIGHHLVDDLRNHLLPLPT